MSTNVHELLKREMFRSGCSGHFEKNKPDPTEIFGISDQYVILDSFYKLQSSNIENGEFIWNFAVQGSTTDGSIGVRDKVDNIIEIQLGTFSLPILPEVPYELGTHHGFELAKNNDTSANPLLAPAQYPTAVPFISPWIHNPYSQLPFNGQLTIQIGEAGLQSYSDKNGARHHFDYTATYKGDSTGNPNMLTAQPTIGTKWDTFTFTEPLKDMHGVTLIFRNPDYPIKFLPDILLNVSTSLHLHLGSYYLRFNYRNHNLLVGDRIFIDGFKSNNSSLNSYINRKSGHVIGCDPNHPPMPVGSNTTSPHEFYLDPIIKFNNNNLNNVQNITIYIAKNRMCIPMRLRRIVPKLTNYIAP